MTDHYEFRLSLWSDPRWKNLKLLAFWAFYGVFFYAVEWLLPRTDYHVMWCPADDLIPFQEIFLIPYLFWFVFMVGAHAYTFFREPEAFRRLMGFILLTFGVSCVVFLLFPTCQKLRPTVFPRDNFLTRLTAWFYGTDTSTNVCPSLHVCGSFAAAAALSDTKRFSSRGWKLLNYGTALLISVSTLFVKQHSLIDVVCGLAMSAGAYIVVYCLPGRRRRFKTI